MRNREIVIMSLVLFATAILGFLIMEVAEGQMTSDITAFNAGAVSPLFRARTDFAKYGNACDTLQNMVVTTLGPVVRRPGLKFISEVKDSNDQVRLIPFEYSNTDTYILEFGPRYMRVFRDGGQVIQNDNSIYEITTPFTPDEVNDLQWVQSADVMYLVDGNDWPRTLTRADHNDWTFTALDYNDGPFQNENTTDTTIEVNTLTISSSALSGWATATAYALADVNDNDSILYECTSAHTSGASTEPGTGASWKTKWKEILLPDGAVVGLTSSDALFASTDVNSLWELSHRRAAKKLSGSFTSATTSSAIACESAYTATTHGTWKGIAYLERSTDNGTSWSLVESRSSEDDDNMLRRDTETESGTIYRFNMTSYTSGTCQYDFVVEDYTHSGSVRITSFVDDSNVVGELTSTIASLKATKLWREPFWSDSEGWPSTIEFHEGRLYYGGNSNWPQTLWSSKTEDWPNMKTGSLDDDAIIFLLPGQNPIQWLLSQDSLLIGSTGAVGVLKGTSTSEPITNTNVPNYQRQTKYGSATLPALLAGEIVLYLERDIRTIRSLTYDFGRDRFVSPDLTVLASHITDSGIIDMAYQSSPDSILWCVRDDGDIAAMVYEQENEVIGWSHIVTDGDFESAAIIPATEEDEVWVIVNRTIDSETRRYVEQVQTYDWGTNQVDAFFVDSGTSWDGGDAVVVTGITNADPGVVTVSTWPTLGDGTNLGDGDQIKLAAVQGMTQVNGTIYTIDDANVTAKTFSLDNSAGSADVNTVGYGAYVSGGTAQRFEKTFTGLTYLEGETLSVMSDGGVLADVTVASDSVTVSQWTNKLHIGLPYTSILETLPLNLRANFGTLAMNQKHLTDIAIDFYQTAGAQYGTNSTNLETISFRAVDDDPNDPVPLYDGKKRMNVMAGWNDEIIIYIEQSYALPLTVRGITTKVGIK